MESQNNEKLKNDINIVLDKVKPYLQADGGDVELVEVTDDFVVKVKLLGACGNCPYSIQTLKIGIEQSLKKEIPQIKEVVAVNL
ncbi:MAG: NifU family protein [Bacteroidales bacterium]|nr:NifU family protein [Bacteroidales bacterium]